MGAVHNRTTGFPDQVFPCEVIYITAQNICIILSLAVIALCFVVQTKVDHSLLVSASYVIQLAALTTLTLALRQT